MYIRHCFLEHVPVIANALPFPDGDITPALDDDAALGTLVGMRSRLHIENVSDQLIAIQAW